MSIMSETKKIPVEEIKKIPPKMLNRLIDQLRDKLKDDPTVQRMFKEYGVEPSSKWSHSAN